MNSQTLEQYILSLDSVSINYPYGRQLAVYSIGEAMFALVEVDKHPLRVSLRCDPLLAKLLKEQYDEVMPGHKLNTKKWITVVASGQLDDDQVKDLTYHSYQLAKQES